jgi:hypothetical protein
MTALRMAAAAALQPVDIYQLPDDEDAIVCQACHLAEMQRPRIVLPLDIDQTSEVPHQQFRDNWDAIFGKKPREPELNWCRKTL